MTPNMGDVVWLAARDHDGNIREGRVVGLRVDTSDTFLYWVEAPFGVVGAYHDVYGSLEEAEAAFAVAVEESRRRAEALPPIETAPPTVGHAKLDALIKAAWKHGNRVACADEGCGDYPGTADGDEIRQLAREIIERGLL